MYYFSQNGETSGPISEADLQARIADGSLLPTVNVWREGMAGWLPYNQVSPAAAPVSAAPPPLRVNVTPVSTTAPLRAQPEYAAAGLGGGATADVQGSTRLESASSWGMVVVVGLAMFVFIGVLASRPRDLVYANGAMEAVDDADALDAEVELKAGVIHLENTSEFPWAATTLSFRSSGSRYTYQLDGIPKDGNVSIPLTDFASTRGGKFVSSPSANPRELNIRVKGHGSATAEINIVP